MKGRLDGSEYDYAELTWAQLCNPSLVLVEEPEKDLTMPPKLNEQAERDLDAAYSNLVSFCLQWGGLERVA